VYNHGQFISDTIDGFLNQKTDFPFEIIVHDDNSQDSSKEIILNYAQRYPKIIKPLIQSVNQYSIAAYRVTNSAFLKASGEYIAWCDGDDYWTLDTKLQQQVQFLEDNNADLCYTDLDILSNNNIKVNIFENKFYPNSFELTEFVINGLFKGPCTWVWRKQVLQRIPENKLLSIDISFYIMAYFLKHFSVVYLPLSTAIYRVLDDSMTHTRNLQKHYDREMELYELQKFLVNDYNLDCQFALKRMKFVKFFFMELTLNKEKFCHFLNENSDVIRSFKPITKRERMIDLILICPFIFRFFVKMYYKFLGFSFLDESNKF
jgi:glycosyltransferase involved in cell wall biosynthesis